ncbi:MAG: nucleotidyl transferase AbiEii/AbiGii toxin family protein, partial [bacterium]
MHPIVFKLKNTTDSLRQKGVSDDTLRVFAKESLQNHILHALYSHPQYKEFIFYGGTCLRKIFGLNRMSGDLDFESVAPFSLNEVGNFVSGYFKSLEFEGIDYSVQQGKRISRVTIKFPIMYELGSSPMQGEKLHIKVEINKARVGKFKTELTPIMEESVSTIIKHYPLNTLMASKMLACLERVFVKGDTGVEVKG